MLESGPLRPGQATTGQRLGSALTLASTAQSSSAKYALCHARRPCQSNIIAKRRSARDCCPH